MTRRCWASLLFIASVQLSCQAGDVPSPGETREVMIAMRDGTRLAAHVFFPNTPMPSGGWPAVVQRSAVSPAQERIQHFIDDGYAFVMQHIRGLHRSGGEPPILAHEAEDGVDTLAWMASQNWCNGKIATYGAELDGFVQYQLSGAGSPHHAAMVCGFAPASIYGHAAYQGGVFRYFEWHKWLTQFAPDSLATYQEHSRYDDFWRPLDARLRYSQANVPGFHVTGWFDQYRKGTIETFVALQANGQQRSQGQQKLLIGPWTHPTLSRSRQGDLEFPANAVIDLRARILGWLGPYLRGEAGGTSLPAVEYYVMGDVDDPDAPGNEWRTADTWPIPGTRTQYYLRAEGLLSTEPPAGSTRDKPRSYASSPYRPLLGRGGGHELEEPTDQAFLEGRPDLLVFTTPELSEPVEVTGDVHVKVWASTKAVDTDFLARLTDVYPDGRSILIAEGIVRARFREGFEEARLPEKDKVYAYTIDLWPTSYVFNHGHKIRVAIGSNNYPRFEGNANNGEDHWHWLSGEPGEVARNTVYHDSAHPSHLLVNVIE